MKFGIFVPFYNSPNVTARQLHLSVSWYGHRGPFVPVMLTGSTSNTAGIIGVIGGPTGFNLRAHHTLTLGYRIRVSKSMLGAGDARHPNETCNLRRSNVRVGARAGHVPEGLFGRVARCYFRRAATRLVLLRRRR